MIAAVVGGGNIGTLMAAEMAARGHEVRVCASDAPSWSDAIEVVDAGGGGTVCVGRPALVTTALGEAVAGADWVLVTHPSSRFAPLSEVLVPLAEPGQRVCAVPGADAEFFFGGLRERGAELLGMQRVHCIARLRERGRSVCQLGRKPSVQLASVPAGAARRRAGELSELLGMPVEALPTYLAETLTPSNPILHTTRLATMFAGWREGVAYPRNFLFYEEWDDASSELMIACDGELQGLCRAAEAELGVDLSGVCPLTEHYESPDARSMTEKISHIPAFRGLTSPMREASDGGWVPDLSSRYFKADFEVGLKAIVDLSDAFGVEAAGMRSVLSWYESVSGVKPARFVPDGKTKIIGLYSTT